MPSNWETMWETISTANYEYQMNVKEIILERVAQLLNEDFDIESDEPQKRSVSDLGFFN